MVRGVSQGQNLGATPASSCFLCDCLSAVAALIGRAVSCIFSCLNCFSALQNSPSLAGRISPRTGVSLEEKCRRVEEQLQLMVIAYNRWAVKAIAIDTALKASMSGKIDWAPMQGGRFFNEGKSQIEQSLKTARGPNGNITTFFVNTYLQLRPLSEILTRRLRGATKNIAYESSEDKRREYLTAYCSLALEILSCARKIALECEEDEAKVVVPHLDRNIKEFQKAMAFESADSLIIP